MRLASPEMAIRHHCDCRPEALDGGARFWLRGSRLDGLELLEVIKERHPDLPVVIISGHGNIETAVSAIKRGAYDYIEKPFKADRLVLVIGRALENSRLKRGNKSLRRARPVPKAI